MFWIYNTQVIKQMVKEVLFTKSILPQNRKHILEQVQRHMVKKTCMHVTKLIS